MSSFTLSFGDWFLDEMGFDDEFPAMWFYFIHRAGNGNLKIRVSLEEMFATNVPAYHTLKTKVVGATEQKSRDTRDE